MNKMVFALVGFVACAGFVFADTTADVTAAASDSGKIPEIVKTLDNGAVAPFAADVMAAVAKMAVSPARRIKQMVDTSVAFLNTTTTDKSDSIIEALVSSVPNTSLPEWTKLFKPTVDAFYEKVSDEDYKKIVGGVLAKIDSDKNVADKVVTTAFALQLLARGETPEEKENWLAFQVIPAASKAQVLEAMPNVFRGNYDGLLAGEKIVESKMFVPPVQLNDVTREGQEDLDDESNVTRVGRPVPLTYRVKGKGKKKSHKKHHDDPTPVPPPYKGQF